MVDYTRVATSDRDGRPVMPLQIALYGPDGLFPAVNLAEWKARFQTFRIRKRRMVLVADVEQVRREIQQTTAVSTK